MGEVEVWFMISRFGSSNRAVLLMGACLLSGSLCGSPAQAGPTLETRENSAIGAQATFNNDWAQTFEAKGSMSMVGGDELLPFQLIETTSALLPNSGLAELTASVSNMSVDGGTLQASASINPLLLVNGTNTPNNVVLNASPETGLPALQITPGTTDSSVIGASIIGTNIGTDSLQVTGSLSTTVINSLTAF